MWLCGGETLLMGCGPAIASYFLCTILSAVFLPLLVSHMHCIVGDGTSALVIDHMAK